jgi:hypothetical protein
MFVPIGSALAAGKAFDFRADILLVLGGLAIIFGLFIAPTVLQMQLSRAVKSGLIGVSGVLVSYGIILTVVPTVWTPFAAKWTLPKIGWAGVFAVAIAFDVMAAVLAFFVLRRMNLPLKAEAAAAAAEPLMATAQSNAAAGRAD